MGLSVNGSEGLGGSAEGFETQNQGVTRRQPGEGPKVNGGRSQSQEMDSYDQPQNEIRSAWDVTENFMGVRDADSVEVQPRISECLPASYEFGDGINEKQSELEKQSKKEKGEHPWASMKIARRIARDHMKEGKITLREFFNLDEAAMLNVADELAKFGFEHTPKRENYHVYTRGNTVIKKRDSHGGSYSAGPGGRWAPGYDNWELYVDGKLVQSVSKDEVLKLAQMADQGG